MQFADFVAAQPTALLCDSLRFLADRRLDADERETRTIVIDVLCARHPEVKRVFDEADAGTEPTTDSVVCAALAAA